MWVEVLCWIDHVWSFKECVCCACDPSVHLGVPSIGFVCVFVCQNLFPYVVSCPLCLNVYQSLFTHVPIMQISPS